MSRSYRKLRAVAVGAAIQNSLYRAYATNSPVLTKNVIIEYKTHRGQKYVAFEARRE